MYLYQRTYDRSNRMQRELPDAIDLLTISVESGLGFDAALQQVAHNTEGPLADEFSRVLREMQIGSSRSEALRALAERTNLAELRSFVSAMVQADAFGIPIANVLRVQSSEMRVKRRQRAEEKAQQVPVKMTIPLIFCILPALFIVVMGPAAHPDHGQLRRIELMTERSPRQYAFLAATTRGFALVALAVASVLAQRQHGRPGRARHRLHLAGGDGRRAAWRCPAMRHHRRRGRPDRHGVRPRPRPRRYQVLTALAFPPFTAALRRGALGALASLVDRAGRLRRRSSSPVTGGISIPAGDQRW